MARTSKNFRLPPATIERLDWLKTRYSSETATVILAIDRLYETERSTMTNYTFTRQDVLDACFADSCASIAKSEGTTSEVEATYGLDMEDNEKAIAANLADLQRGQEILTRARLITGQRFRTGTVTPRPLIATDAPVVEVSAGHTANQEAVREYTLVRLTEAISKGVQ